MLYSLSEIRNIPILFIVGKGRSGTTLLSTILDSHPKVASATESRFLLILWQKYKRMKKWNAAKAEVFFEDVLVDLRIKNLWEFEEDFMEDRSRRRNVSRAIPASAVSRRRPSSRELNQFKNDEPIRRRQTSEDRDSKESVRNNFGERRNSSRNEVKTGSRPSINRKVSRQDNISSDDPSTLRKKSTRSSVRQQTVREQVEDASFKDANAVKKPREIRRVGSSSRSSSKNQNSRYNVGRNKKKPRDNSSRFDD